MTNFFQIITTKITTFITVVIITASSILPWSATNTNKPVDSPTTTLSTTISKSPSPSASITPTTTQKVKNKIENTPTTVSTPASPQTLAPQPTNSSPPTSNIKPKTYSIVPISIMEIGSMEQHLQIIARSAYQEFLRTSNLNQLNESNQMEILVGIYSRMLKEEIAATQQNISQLKQENTPTPTPAAVYVNTEVESKLAELRQTLEYIQNQPVAMNVIYGRMERAYQDWINNNPEIYAVILGSRYTNDLNAILRAYGL